MHIKMNGRQGSGTLEILIAFAIVILSITAAISVVFGNQHLIVDTELDHQAFYKASRELNTVQAAAVSNFNGVTSTPAITLATNEGAYNNIYTKKIDVLDISPCAKQVTSHIAWKTDPLRPQSVDVATLLISTSSAAALGGDCIVSSPSGNWQTLSSVSGGDGSVNGTGIDAKSGVAYLSANSTAANKPDLLIYTYDPVAKVINPRGTLDTGSHGFNAIDVAGKYAYAANDESTYQLQVIDVSNIDSPIRVASSSLDSSSIPTIQRVDPSGPNPQGRSIAYYNGRIYLGVGKTTGSEFHVFDVSNPLNPVWLGSFKLGQDINDIVVRGNYAYLATSGDSSELTILDVSDPANIRNVAMFDAIGSEDAQSLFVLGNELYLGRRQGADPNFFIVDISSSTAPTNCVTCSKNMGGEDVNGIIVIGNFAFLATSNNLEILNISNPASVGSVASLPVPKTATGIDFSNNLIYVPFVKQGSTLMNIYYPGP